ncbi:DNA-protecting protein DprA [Micrococcus porci]|uniref:DNA-processing protein DprA n=1 Tax=Micrococcus porci TaxID=2856555 RepID=UPI001CCE7FE9|nr:DNA-processing protein DprA [Micrococcus porci]UBH24007.1 DNA-protecting protein DprA [Micrococcus porci]
MSGVAGLGVDERRARVVLALLAEPDDPVTGGLLRRLGAVETLGLLDTDTTVPGLGRVDGQVWRDRLTSQGRLDGLDQRLRVLEESGIVILIPGDAQWPRALDDLGERAPYVLFVRGAASFLARPMQDLVTVTGSRAASAYGEYVAAELAGDLANRERVLVAGGAYGVESAVHRAALAAGGDTIAVLAGGVDRPYPSGNRDLLDRVGDVGALVSELPPGSVPTRHRFLARSRLLGAMSAATVVVEAGARSGAIGVAAEAHQLGRQVGAVPGPVTSVTSHGPHELLRAGHARLVTSAADVEELTANRATHRPGLSADFTRHTAPAAGPPERSL